MLNTGAFLLRRSEWSRSFLRRVWGKQELAAGAGPGNARRWARKLSLESDLDYYGVSNLSLRGIITNIKQCHHRSPTQNESPYQTDLSHPCLGSTRVLLPPALQPFI